MRLWLSNPIVYSVILMAGAQTAAAYTCDTTQVTSDTMRGMDDTVYLADCRILTAEASPFVLQPQQSAVFTAEQQIRLTPGFHAQHGSHLHAKLRDCIRNPEPNLGYASWGNYDRYTSVHPIEECRDQQWMKLTAEAFVDHFSSHGLSVELKYGEELAKYGIHIPDFYCDAQRIAERVTSGALPPTNCAGADDDHVLLQIDEGSFDQRALELAGIDDGVFFFHIGHGGGNTLGPSVRNGDETSTTSTTNADGEPVEVSDGHSTKIYWTQFGLGNCSSDGSATGELRYLLLCSCRSFGHGPPISDNDGKGNEYDRPSLFDPDATAPVHANVFARLGPVLADNMRMACGASTTASCQPHIADKLKTAYLDDGLSVAESWGEAHTQGIPERGIRGEHPLTDIGGCPIYDSNCNQMTRNIYLTPLCIARGNYNVNDLRSPITDDLRFSEKANPYDEALHIVYWETYASVTEPGAAVEVAEQATDMYLRPVHNDSPYIKVSRMAGRENIANKGSANLATQIGQLPVLLIEPVPAVWFEAGKQMVADGEFLAEAQASDKYIVNNDTIISRETTSDGRPKLKVDMRKGKITLAGNRARLSIAKDNKILSIKEYAELATGIIERQGWNENDMAQLVAIKAGLQVMPLRSESGAQSGMPKVVKTQKDITFQVRRKLRIDNISVRTLGPENQILVQLNNDGSIIRASKRWNKITQNVDGIPVKGFEVAYAEAQQQLENPMLYELTDWDWGYRTITHASGRELMVLQYTFSFEPLSLVAACIDSPRIIEIQGHLLGPESLDSKLKGIETGE